MFRRTVAARPAGAALAAQRGARRPRRPHAHPRLRGAAGAALAGPARSRLGAALVGVAVTLAAVKLLDLLLFAVFAPDL
ncbi:hypothetical protein [Nannocystis pusilla]|uniref:hypothetical protein n=1 Tax=Nannocystis pusilla TaxID=889268 RepID=UPI003B7E06AC